MQSIALCAVASTCCTGTVSVRCGFWEYELLLEWSCTVCTFFWPQASWQNWVYNCAPTLLHCRVFLFPGRQVRLESVPEMNYDALGQPGRGEVCIRGATLFSGYYKRDELTKEAMDAEGWFHTGTPK